MSYVIFPRYNNIIYRIHSAVYHGLMAPVFYHWKFVPLIPFTSFAALPHPTGSHQLFLYEFVFILCCLCFRFS